MANLKYRSEIDGLRALAVIPVILFHSGLELFSGGFIGVDVFFVISGYLITTIIISEIFQERFSLINFYERRARRILPALLFVCIITLLVSPFFLGSEQIFDLGQTLFSISVFASNYFFYSEIDYFNEFSLFNPLLHTWSLAVEEQFYIFFPLLLLLLSSFRKGYMYIIFAILLVCLASFFNAVELTSTNRDLAFYSLHTRGWELMIGALISVLLYLNYLKPIEQQNYSITNEILLMISLVTLFLSFTSFTSSTLHPGLMTLIPVIATTFIILYANQNSFVGSLLGSKVLVKIGLWSYSLYLIHYPIYSFIDIYYDFIDVKDRAQIKIIIIPVIFLLSWLSYKFIETPFRNKSKFSGRFIFSSTLVSLFLISCIGLLIHHNQGFPKQLNQFNEYFGKSPLLDVSYEKDQLSSLRNKYKEFKKKSLCYSSDHAECKRILIIGDSMARDAFYSLAEFSSQLSLSFFPMDEGCMSEFSAKKLPEQMCIAPKFNVKTLIEEVNWATDVIISAEWGEYYFGGYSIAKYLIENFDTNIFIAGNIQFSDMQNIHLKPRYKDFKNQNLENNFFYRSIKKDVIAISDSLSSKINSLPGVEWIEKSELFCNFKDKECNLLNKDRQALIWDGHHLTVEGLFTFNKFLNNKIMVKKEKVP